MFRSLTSFPAKWMTAALWTSTSKRLQIFTSCLRSFRNLILIGKTYNTYSKTYRSSLTESQLPRVFFVVWWSLLWWSSSRRTRRIRQSNLRQPSRRSSLKNGQRKSFSRSKQRKQHPVAGSAEKGHYFTIVLNKSVFKQVPKQLNS